VKLMMSISRKMGAISQSVRQSIARWLRQGMSPRRLALTLALGLAIGCIPVVGIPTLVCAALALTLRLSLPAIQAANYAAMPLQLILIVPFMKLGGWLMAGTNKAAGAPMLHRSAMGVLTQMGGFAGQALLAWLVIAVPAVFLMTLMLTLVLRRVPVFAAAEAGD
jgi:uncharacterized protein (DUF2062 family)